jgi:hypothetical protein
MRPDQFAPTRTRSAIICPHQPAGDSTEEGKSMNPPTPPTPHAALVAIARYAETRLTLRAFSAPLLSATSAAPRREALQRVSAYQTPTDAPAGKPLPTPTRA